MFTKIKALGARIGQLAKAKRLFAVQLILVLLTGTIVVTLDESVKTIQIKDAGSVTQIRTIESDPYEILELAGVAVSADDQVRLSGGEKDVIEISRAIPVTVAVDGAAKTVKLFAGQTVADALRLCAVVVDADDKVSPAVTTEVTKDMQITVTRVEPAVAAVSAPAANDKKAEQTNKTQKVSNNTQSSQAAAAKPVSGNANVISTLTPETPIELDANGRPVNYVKKLTGKATAYCKGTTCATGVKVRPGYIAVNPKQIPYGTKMYIVSADGKYNYGYSIAADTGGFAKNGSAIADLYMYSYDDCIQFGRRNIEIYILD